MKDTAAGGIRATQGTFSSFLNKVIIFGLCFDLYQSLRRLPCSIS